MASLVEASRPVFIIVDDETFDPRQEVISTEKVAANSSNPESISVCDVVVAGSVSVGDNADVGHKHPECISVDDTDVDIGSKNLECISVDDNVDIGSKNPECISVDDNVDVQSENPEKGSVCNVAVSCSKNPDGISVNDTVINLTTSEVISEDDTTIHSQRPEIILEDNIAMESRQPVNGSVSGFRSPAVTPVVIRGPEVISFDTHRPKVILVDDVVDPCARRQEKMSVMQSRQKALTDSPNEVNWCLSCLTVQLIFEYSTEGMVAKTHAFDSFNITLGHFFSDIISVNMRQFCAVLQLNFPNIVIKRKTAKNIPYYGNIQMKSKEVLRQKSIPLLAKVHRKFVMSRQNGVSFLNMLREPEFISKMV
ncbi:uncharacterized protein LOC144452950 [Glandiceps talaboti]